MKIYTRDDMYRKLEEFGIATLSGESDNLGFRLTTDVSPKAVPLVEEYLAVTLRQEGWNGWAREIGGQWIPGRNRAWAYDKDGHNKKRDNWETADGKSFHCPRSMLKELFIYLLIKHGAAAVIETEAVNAPGYRISSQFYTFESMVEYRRFRETMSLEQDRLRDGLEEGQYEDDVEQAALYLAARVEKLNLGWSIHIGYSSLTNTHAFSGRTLV